MLTLDQIKNVTFTKTMGGYKTSEVDDFIDHCADTVATLIEERNASNKKLEVLADKLVEYRNEEDSIRSALVSAQRLGDTIVREANQKASLSQEDAAIKAEKIIADAQAKADGILSGITDEVAAQQAELARIKREVTLFKERMLSIYKEHLSLIDLLPEEPVEEEPTIQPEEAPVEETEPVAEKAPVPQPEEEPVAVAASAPVAKEPVGVPLVSLKPETEEKAEKAPKEEAPKSRFGDLKFGEDYVIAEDETPGESKGFFKRKK